MASASFKLAAVDDTKAAFASVQNSLQSLDKQMSSIGKGFQLGNILKGVMSGLGIGSAIQIAQTAIQSQVDKRKEEAEAAEAVNKYSEEQLRLVRENIALRQTEAQQAQTKLAELNKQRQELEKIRDTIVDTERRKFTPVQRPGSAFRTEEENRANVRERIRDLTEAERVALAQTGVELQKVGNQIDAINIKEDDRLAKLREEERLLIQQRRILTLTDVLSQQEKAFADLLEVQKKSNEEDQKNRDNAKRTAEQIEAKAESYRKLADPLRIYDQQLEDINKLEREGALTMVQAAAARDAVLRIRKKTQEETINTLLDDFFGDMDKINAQTSALGQAANDLGFSFASAFESAVLAGEKLSNVMRSIAQDVLRVFLRLSVTNPLINTIFGGVPGFSKLPAFGGMKATGGPVNDGTAYMVGEKGPEIFVPRGSGTIIPNHALGGSGGGSSVAGTNVNVTYNIAAGVTKSELMPILETERKRLKAEIPDMVRRGGAYRGAFA